jgi:predicted nucleic acid-binding protein
VIIGIDSMILIYAECIPSKNGKRCSDFDDLRVRSRLLLVMAERKKHTILLPTVAISELLVPVPKSQQGPLIKLLQKKFICPPFDLPAASIAADLIARHKELPRDQRYDMRNVVRADAMIIASAKAAGATEFYTHDGKCRTLAGLVLTPRDLPTQDPDDMFLAGEIARGEA